MSDGFWVGWMGVLCNCRMAMGGGLLSMLHILLGL